MTWSAKVFTLFPELFPGPLGASVVGSGLTKKLWSLEAVNLRDYATDAHKTVDDGSFGGGPGMVMRPDVVDAAFRAHYKKPPGVLIYVSPRGIPLTQGRVKELAKETSVGVLCGRFEGVDQRVLEAWDVEELSLGDFVLSGGEIPAMALIDACVRLLPGVLGSPESLVDESFSEGLLEYPQYTRPFDWEGRTVPEILRSGHHEKVKAWRQAQSEKITRKRRPDLWRRYCEDRKDRKGHKERE